jgi:hypothetical protein
MIVVAIVAVAVADVVFVITMATGVTHIIRAVGSVRCLFGMKHCSQELPFQTGRHLRRRATWWRLHLPGSGMKKSVVGCGVVGTIGHRGTNFRACYIGRSLRHLLVPFDLGLKLFHASLYALSCLIMSGSFVPINCDLDLR